MMSVALRSLTLCIEILLFAGCLRLTASVHLIVSGKVQGRPMLSKYEARRNAWQRRWIRHR